MCVPIQLFSIEIIKVFFSMATGPVTSLGWIGLGRSVKRLRSKGSIRSAGWQGRSSLKVGGLERMIDRSYALVVRQLRRADRQSLEIAHGRDALYR